MSVAERITTARPVVAARAFLTRAGLAALRLIVQYAPVFGRVAVRRRRRIVLAPYKRTSTVWGAVRNVLAVPAVVLGCTIYGFGFGLTAPTFIVPFVIPVAILTVLIIWALPDLRRAPTLPIELLLPAFFIFMILWPEYLAISLPGLPWITMLRLIGLPMLLTFLISLSVSSQFRARVAESVSGVKLTWICMCGFVVIQVLTLVFSTQPFSSLEGVFNEQIYWTFIFVISCVMFRDIRYVERYWALLCLLAIPIVILTGIEFKRQYILWAAHIPPILHPPDPSVQMTLTPSFRPGTGVYRAKATFSTQLGLAEYLSLLTPLFLHFGMSRINALLRAGSFLMIPVLFLAIRDTDARLGLVGMLASIFLYGMLWSVVRWRTHPRDLLAAAAVYGYPAVFALGVGLIFSSHSMKLMILGGGAQQGSTDARKEQLTMGMQGLMKAPWGHGHGQSGLAMGFAKDAFITIDNYFIGLALDYGVLGVIFWYGIFISSIVAALRCCLSMKYAGKPEARLLAPLAVMLIAFLIIKWVHGQTDNHPIYFMMAGMISALVYRLRHHSPTPISASAT